MTNKLAVEVVEMGEPVACLGSRELYERKGVGSDGEVQNVNCHIFVLLCNIAILPLLRKKVCKFSYRQKAAYWGFMNL